MGGFNASITPDGSRTHNRQFSTTPYSSSEVGFVFCRGLCSRTWHPNFIKALPLLQTMVKVPRACSFLGLRSTVLTFPKTAFSFFRCFPIHSQGSKILYSRWHPNFICRKGNPQQVPVVPGRESASGASRFTPTVEKNSAEKEMNVELKKNVPLGWNAE